MMISFPAGLYEYFKGKLYQYLKQMSRETAPAAEALENGEP
jgi:hypothetical protein